MTEVSERAKFKRKPEEVEAFQMTEERRWDNRDWPEWLNRAWQEKIGATGGVWCNPQPANPTSIFVGAVGGAVMVKWGDWIIKDWKGNLSVCAPNIFEETYE